MTLEDDPKNEECNRDEEDEAISSKCKGSQMLKLVVFKVRSKFGYSWGYRHVHKSRRSQEGDRTSQPRWATSEPPSGRNQTPVLASAQRWRCKRLHISTAMAFCPQLAGFNTPLEPLKHCSPKPGLLVPKRWEMKHVVCKSVLWLGSQRNQSYSVLHTRILCGQVLSEETQQTTTKWERWQLHENLVLIAAHKQQVLEADNSKKARGHWEEIACFCERNGVYRSADQCKLRWNKLNQIYSKIISWEKNKLPDSKSFWLMSSDEKKSQGLRFFIDKETFDALDDFLINSVFTKSKGSESESKVDACGGMESATTESSKDHIEGYSHAVPYNGEGNDEAELLKSTGWEQLNVTSEVVNGNHIHLRISAVTEESSMKVGVSDGTFGGELPAMNGDPKIINTSDGLRSDSLNIREVTCLEGQASFTGAQVVEMPKADGSNALKGENGRDVVTFANSNSSTHEAREIKHHKMDDVYLAGALHVGKTTYQKHDCFSSEGAAHNRSYVGDASEQNSDCKFSDGVFGISVDTFEGYTNLAKAEKEDHNAVDVNVTNVHPQDGRIKERSLESHGSIGSEQKYVSNDDDGGSGKGQLGISSQRFEVKPCFREKDDVKLLEGIGYADALNALPSSINVRPQKAVLKDQETKNCLKEESLNFLASGFEKGSFDTRGSVICDHNDVLGTKKHSKSLVDALSLNVSGLSSSQGTVLEDGIGSGESMSSVGFEGRLSESSSSEVGDMEERKGSLNTLDDTAVLLTQDEVLLVVPPTRTSINKSTLNEEKGGFPNPSEGADENHRHLAFLDSSPEFVKEPNEDSTAEQGQEVCEAEKQVPPLFSSSIVRSCETAVEGSKVCVITDDDSQENGQELNAYVLGQQRQESPEVQEHVQNSSPALGETCKNVYSSNQGTEGDDPTLLEGLSASAQEETLTNVKPNNGTTKGEGLGPSKQKNNDDLFSSFWTAFGDSVRNVSEVFAKLFKR